MSDTTKTETEMTEMVNLTIDGNALSVSKGTTVYTAARKLGIDIPIFCYQDRMPPFGACRVCLVEVEKMPKLQTSCTLVATEGMVVKSQTQMAVEGRKSILEFLLINHPLDCPVCDRGGECPLQDQALKFGPGESRFYEEKRHFIKPIPLGPVLMLDRERCIICARCTRFGDEIAGDHALEFQDRGFKTEVCTPDGGPAESKFIGNTIMICPVGALTSQVYRFRARPWDNLATPSTCTLCPVGCSMILDSRDGEVMRTRSCENKDVNDVWMCDKGWFGYEYVSNTERLQTPLIRRDGQLQTCSWDEALSLIASKMTDAKAKGKLGALGGNPLTTEENFFFQQLIRQGAGVDNIDHRVGSPIFSLEEEAIAPGMEISIGDCEQLSYVLLAGIDLTEEFPVIWLRLRQAINKGAKVIFVGHFAPEIAPHLYKTITHAPGKELDSLKIIFPEMTKLAGNGQKGAIFVGSQYTRSDNRGAVLAELSKFSQSAQNISLNILEGRGNSMGARLAGMRPDMGPLGKSVGKPGLNAIQILEAAAEGGWDFLHVAGTNPVTQFPKKLWKEARAKLGFLVVQDLFLTETAQQADVVLPVLSAIEKGGTFVNIEGRMQPLLPGKEIPIGIYSDGQIFAMIAQKLKINLEIDAEFAHVLKSGRHTPPRAGKDIQTKVQKSGPSEGALLASFAHALFDRGVRMNHDPHVSQLVKPARMRINPLDAFKLNIANGNRISINVQNGNGNAVTGVVKLDEKVAPGTVVLPLGFDDFPVHNLGTNLMNGLPIELNNTFIAQEQTNAF
ncbi:MAG TPA: NADH-quinone oxidoreductase subunit NuoG [Parachlamydiaceae bacterium]|nr:NADH-quinone oxidoreductase subunit NuoG [Parachlamydiaceae bacterium]